MDTLTGRAASVDELLAEAFDVSTESLATTVDSVTSDEGWFEALTALVVDALLVADQVTIHVLVDRLTPLSMLEDEVAERSFGRLVALLDVGRAAQDRLMSEPATLGISPGTRLADVLLQVADNRGISNQQIGAHLKIDKTEVSRQCSRLKHDGLAVSRRAGKNTFWQLTSRGDDVARQLRDATGAPPGDDVDDVRDISSKLDTLDTEALADAVASVLESIKDELSRLAKSRPRPSSANLAGADAYNLIVAPKLYDTDPWCVSATLRRHPRAQGSKYPRLNVDDLSFGDFVPAAIAYGGTPRSLMDPFAGHATPGGYGVLAETLEGAGFIAVAPNADGNWKVVKSGNTRATSVHETKADAAKAGRMLAKKEGWPCLLIEHQSTPPSQNMSRGGKGTARGVSQRAGS